MDCPPAALSNLNRRCTCAGRMCRSASTVHGRSPTSCRRSAKPCPLPKTTLSAIQRRQGSFYFRTSHVRLIRQNSPTQTNTPYHADGAVVRPEFRKTLSNHHRSGGGRRRCVRTRREIPPRFHDRYQHHAQAAAGLHNSGSRRAPEEYRGGCGRA